MKQINNQLFALFFSATIYSAKKPKIIVYICCIQNGKTFMNEVIAHIDISTPTDRRIVNELQKHRKSVRMEYLESENIVNVKTYTLEESFDECCDILSKNYGLDVWTL
jgi:hypothetical protein